MASSVKKHGIETKLAISKVKLAKTGNSLNTLRSHFNRNTHSWFSPSHLLTPTSLAFGAILSTIILSIPLLATLSVFSTQPRCASRGRIDDKYPRTRQNRYQTPVEPKSGLEDSLKQCVKPDTRVLWGVRL